MRLVSKKLYLTLSIMTAVLISGCAEVESITAVKTDPSMPMIKGVKHITDKTSVGFEWPEIQDKRVEGIDIYRAVQGSGSEQKYRKIATIGNRYVTHFVDTDIKPNTNYLYTFRTYGVLYGSAPGEIVKIKTEGPFGPVSFFKAFMVDKGVVKLLWTPHPDLRIHDYILERKVAGREWKYLANIKGRLSPEYVDMSPAKGRTYSYRIIARSADGFRSKPSTPATITVQ